MALELEQFDVYLNPVDPDAPPDRVAVRWADQLLAEREGPRHGLTDMKAQKLHFVTYWCWAAMVREGNYAGDFQQFMNVDLAGIVPVKEAAPVDPTAAVPPGSPSS